MSDNTLELIKSIQEKQKSIKIFIGSTIGIIFLIYFFTFAMLVDKFPAIFFIIEGITSAIFFVMLFMLNPISFAILKIRTKKDTEKAALIERMDKNDVDEKPEKVLESFQ